MKSDLTFEQNENVIMLFKQYNAPKERLFEMFSNPDNLGRWWGPANWPATIIGYDFRSGGRGHYYMQGPDGKRAYGVFTFEEIDEPNMISYSDAFADEHGAIDESLPIGYITFKFIAEEGGTTLTMTGRYDTKEQADKIIAMGMIDGMRDTWSQLDTLVSA